MRRLPIEQARQIIDDGIPVGPRMYPCVCGAGRHAHAGKNATGANPDTGCIRYRANMAWELAYQALDAQATSLGHSLREADNLDRAKHSKRNPRKPGEWRIGASDTGTCPRKIQYRNVPPEGFVPAPEDQREARAGQMLHEGIVARLQRLYPWRLYEHPVKIAGLDRESRLDWYDPITGEVVDAKTLGNWKWDQYGDFGPPDDVWEQGMLYGLALEDAGYNVKTIRVSAYKRENGHDETFVRPYERAFAEKARDRLLSYATMLDLGIDLPKTGTGPTNDGLCRRCFARNDCWNIPAAEQARRSPESYTVLGADPAIDDIIWAISQRVEASEETSAAKKLVDASKTLLDGVEPGRYGPYEGYERKASASGGPDYKADAEHLRELLDLPDGMRPSADEVPVPVRRESTYIQWGRVRKATLDREKRDRAAANEGAA